MILTIVVQSLISCTETICAPAASPLKVPDDWYAPPSRLYWYGDVPPAADKVTLPVEPPKQSTFICETMAPVRGAGCVMTTLTF